MNKLFLTLSIIIVIIVTFIIIIIILLRLDRLKEKFTESFSSLRTHFNKLDASGDGILNKEELFGALDQAGISLEDEERESVWRILDEDQV